ncbi:MAG: diguanylate cyclase [Phycisphaeraceae bacterium]
MSKTVEMDPAAQQRIAATLAKLGPAAVRSAALMELLRAAPSDADHMLMALQSDPALTARVLSVLNSAAFGLRSRITCIQRAIAMLGSARARSIGLAYGLRLMVEQTGLPRATLDTLWNNAIAKACAARLFCLIAEPDLAEEAYAAGLIQDIGLPMLMAVDPAFYEAHVLNGSPRGTWVAAEQWRFGIDHAQVGQYVLEKWDCAPVVCSMVGLHHRPLSRLPDQRGDSLLYLASFLGGLLPHGYEEPAGWQRNWINAVHARFMALQYATPDAFILAAIQESRTICGRRQPDDDLSREAVLSHLIAAVGDDAVTTVSHLVRLEHAMQRERHDMLEMREQAFTDPLTRLLNRRGFAELGRRRLAAAATGGAGVCVLLADLDDFKTINDTHGHDRGDRMLRAFAKLLRRNLRRNDLIGRIGGDEFVMILTDIDAATAHRLCCQVVENIEGQVVRLDDFLTLPIHFSVGAAFFRNIAEDTPLDALLTFADQSLYQRKRCGKRGLSFIETAAPGQVARSSNPTSHVRAPTRARPE